MDFQYVARTKDGVVEKDIISALNEKGAADALRARGLMPTMVKPVKRNFNFSSILEFLGTVKLIDKITFIKNLGVMIKAGLPVSRALKILSVQTPNKKFAKIVSDVARQVESGKSLADAVGKYPNVFSSIFVSMIRAGEVSGNLEANLGYLSDQMQRDYDLMSKARGALIYPAVILTALGLVGFVMFTFVLPKLTATFKDLNVTLPLMTRIIIGVVDIFAQYGLLLLLGVILAGFGFFYWRRTDSGKKVIHKVVLYLPIFSQIVIKINTARFIRVFSSLIKSGMSIVEALDISSQVVGNIYFQKTISESASKVKVGSPLSAGFKKYPKLYSDLVIQMMEVGEESGTTDTVLAEIAEFYESDLDQTMKNLSSILEPVIMVIIGVVVGVLAVGLITPIYNITQNIN